MGVTLTVAQRTICLVAFDRFDPADLDDEHQAAAVRIFGPVDRIPSAARKILAAVCGARGGKSYILSAMYSLWRMLTADLSLLAAGETAFAPVVAPDKKTARQVLSYVKGAVENHPDLAPLVTASDTDSITLKRADGAIVALEVLAASRGGAAIRGRSMVSAVLDEAAFFRDQESKVNDVDIFDAVHARVIPGGLVVIASTPWAETGLLHKFYADNWGAPKTALVAHAPTLLLRDNDPAYIEMVEAVRSVDPVKADREYGAQFTAIGSGLFFSPVSVDQAVTDEPIEVVRRPNSHTGRVGFGADLGLRHDSSAIVVLHEHGDEVHVVEVLEIQPTRDAPLKLSSVCRDFAEVVLRHRGGSFVADQHAIDPAREHTAQYEITIDEAPAGQSGKIDSYTIARQALHAGRIRIPRRYEKLARQLREVIGKPLPGGGLSIQSPRNTGGHGDIASAFVLALWDLEQHGQSLSPIERDNLLPPLASGSRWLGMGRGF
jgi:putative intracellular protease/amidase